MNVKKVLLFIVVAAVALTLFGNCVTYYDRPSCPAGQKTEWGASGWRCVPG